MAKGVLGPKESSRRKPDPSHPHTELLHNCWHQKSSGKEISPPRPSLEPHTRFTKPLKTTEGETQPEPSLQPLLWSGSSTAFQVTRTAPSGATVPSLPQQKAVLSLQCKSIPDAEASTALFRLQRRVQEAGSATQHFLMNRHQKASATTARAEGRADYSAITPQGSHKNKSFLFYFLIYHYRNI